jgi:hypothetical protein
LSLLPSLSCQAERVLAVHSSAKEQEVARFSERTKITGIVFLCAATR